jgi:hypothetical protein
VRIFLIGLPLAAACLTGFTTACSNPHPAGPASAAAASAPAPASAGRASAEGILAGHLYAVGGPPPGAPRPWPGTVTLIGPGVHRAIAVGAGGSYSVLVPAGTYAVAGRSPLYQDGAGACRATGPVTVTSGHRTRADVLCQLR